MFQKLYKLIFGLDEFTKTKIELRFELAKELTDKLQVQSIEDFDLLESCIYKIKDQLRVKSSNLNTTIKNQNNSLTKQEVEEFLQKLLHLRSSFLNTAFTAIQKQTPSQKQSNSNTLSITTTTYTCTLSTKGGLHVKITFNEEVDLKQLRIISSLLYEITKAQGTTILIEDTTALIIPRTNDDGIIKPLPQQNNDEQIEEVFTTLTNNNNDEHEQEVKRKEEFKSRFKDEQNLDSLLSTYQQSSPPSHHEQQENDTIDFEKDEPIEFEKQQQKAPNEITIQTTDPMTIYKDDQIIVEANPKSPLFGEIKISPVNSSKTINHLDDSTFSYLFLFSKIFASALFDVMQSHGTNIMWQGEDTAISIIPRFKNDEAIQQWTPQQLEEENLNQVQQTLLQKLAQQSSQHTQQQKEEPPKKQHIKLDDDTKQKAKYLLDELRKIP